MTKSKITSIKKEDYTVLHINAKEGKYSTFWQGKSGRWYPKLYQAARDDAQNAVNPEDYRYEKPFWREHKVAIAVIVTAVVALVAAKFYFTKKH